MAAARGLGFGAWNAVGQVRQPGRRGRRRSRSNQPARLLLTARVSLTRLVLPAAQTAHRTSLPAVPAVPAVHTTAAGGGMPTGLAGSSSMPALA